MRSTPRGMNSTAPGPFQPNLTLQSTPISATSQRPLSARGYGGVRANLNSTAPAHMQNGNVLSAEDQLNAFKKEAIMQFNAGNFQQAEALFKQVLEIVQSMYPPNHPECIKAEKSILLVQRKAQTGK